MIETLLTLWNLDFPEQLLLHMGIHQPIGIKLILILYYFIFVLPLDLIGSVLVCSFIWSLLGVWTNFYPLKTTCYGFEPRGFLDETLMIVILSAKEEDYYSGRKVGTCICYLGHTMLYLSYHAYQLNSMPQTIQMSRPSCLIINYKVFVQNWLKNFILFRSSVWWRLFFIW